MQETWVWSLGQGDLLEKEMTTHCNILAWKIPCTEEPGRATVHGVTKSWTWVKQQQQHHRVSSRSAPLEPGYWSSWALPQAHIIQAFRQQECPRICRQILPFSPLWMFVILQLCAPESPAPGALSLTITWLPKSHIRHQGLLVRSLSSWVQSL